VPTLDKLGFLTVLWLFPVAVTLHETEEWNILRWYRRNFQDLPPLTDASARMWIVVFSLVVLLWFATASLTSSPSVAALVTLPAIALMVQNGLQHIFWLLSFRRYAPGVITSVLLIIPLGSHIAIRALRHGYAPTWYVALLVALILPGLVQTVRAGDRMTPQLRAMHRLGIKLSNWILGS
jgi:hypothetical protein